MPKFNVEITHEFRAYRTITVEVEAPSLDEAVDAQKQRDAPPYDDPRWNEHLEFRDEYVRPPE